MAAKKPFPKSIGACADMLYDLREKRLAADKVAKELKGSEQALIDHIVDHLDKESSGASGKHHRVQVKTKSKPRVITEKWNEFYAWVAKNKAFDCLQRRLGEEAIQARLDAGKKIPGVEMFNAVTVSLTKV